MCEHSTGDHGAEKLTSSAEDSLARILVQRETGLELKERNLGYGKNSFALLEKSGPDLYLWKTHQFSLLGGLESFLETWPGWGIMLAGECWELNRPAHLTRETESGFSLPTPTKCDNSKVSKNPEFWARRLAQGRSGMDNLPEFATTIFQGGDGRIHPHLHEWLMGWPIGMTDLQPLETDKFQQWLASHGKL